MIKDICRYKNHFAQKLFQNRFNLVRKNPGFCSPRSKVSGLSFFDHTYHDIMPMHFSKYLKSLKRRFKSRFTFRCLMVSHKRQSMMIPRPRPLSSTEPHHWSRDKRTLSWTELCNSHTDCTATATGKLLTLPKPIRVSWLYLFSFGFYKMLILWFSITEVLFPDLQFSNQRSYSSQLNSVRYKEMRTIHRYMTTILTFHKSRICWNTDCRSFRRPFWPCPPSQRTEETRDRRRNVPDSRISTAASGRSYNGCWQR